ncbi:MAG: hypothetical protein JJU36_03670 [Phycisphaeraceae bacterium]|nr:hypothetical protein [Phycisphaeraceae bacterium]
MSEAISQPESEPVAPVEIDAGDVGSAIGQSEPDPVEPDAVLSACKRWLALGVDPYIIVRRLEKKFGSVIAQQAEMWVRRAREEMLASLNVPDEQRTAEAVWFYKYIISHPKATISQKLRARIRIDQLIGLTPMPTPRTPGPAPAPGSFPGPGSALRSFTRSRETSSSVPGTPGSAPTSGSNLGTPGWGSVRRAAKPAERSGSAPGSESRYAADALNPERFGDGASETVAKMIPAGDEQHGDQTTPAAQDLPPTTQDSAGTRIRQRPDDRRGDSAAADRFACKSSGAPGGYGDFPASRKVSQGRAGGGGASGGVSRRLPTRAQRRAAAREQQKAARRAARSSGSSQPMANPISTTHATRPVPAAQERAPP